jgi:hypothetical protein
MPGAESALLKLDPSCRFDSFMHAPQPDDAFDRQGSGSNSGGGQMGEDGGNASGESGDGASNSGGPELWRPQYMVPTPVALPMMPKHDVQPTQPATSPPVNTLRAATACATSALEREGTRGVRAIESSAYTGDRMHRFVDSIVAEVAELCANPNVMQSGNWQITLPIDAAMLPGCTLDVALSHFQLTLRFVTTEQRSRQLISQHIATLRASLEQVVQSRLDGTRSVEITVS